MEKKQKTNKKLESKTVVDSKTVVAVDHEMVKNSIENKAANPNGDQKAFLTKRKVIWTSIFVVISIALVALTLRFVLNIQWGVLFMSIGAGFDHKMGYLWFSLLLMTCFINLLRCFITLWPRIAALGCHIGFGQWMLYAITIVFLSCVTPAAIVIDPYTIFWMKTHGISTSKCASIIFTNTLFWQINQIFLTLPPFIICACNYHLIARTPAGKAVFWLIVIGFGLDWITLAICYFMCTSKKFHYGISVIFNWFKKKFHKKYHTKAEIAQKYKKNAVIKQDFIAYMKDWKTTLTIFLLFMVGDVLGTFALAWGMWFVQYVPAYGGTVKVGFHFGWLYVCARLSIPANRLNFLPGAALGYEWALAELVTVFGGWNPSSLPESAKTQVTTNGILMVRLFTNYIPAIAGIGGFVALTIQQAKLSKKGKLIEHKY